MKRSEMLEEIRKILALNGKDNGEGELEEAILHHIEESGMLPPPVKLDPVTSSIVYCYYPNVVEKTIGYNYFIDFEKSQLWEPEDELP